MKISFYFHLPPFLASSQVGEIFQLAAWSDIFFPTGRMDGSRVWGLMVLSSVGELGENGAMFSFVAQKQWKSLVMFKIFICLGLGVWVLNIEGKIKLWTIPYQLTSSIEKNSFDISFQFQISKQITMLFTRKLPCLAYQRARLKKITHFHGIFICRSLTCYVDCDTIEAMQN